MAGFHLKSSQIVSRDTGSQCRCMRIRRNGPRWFWARGRGAAAPTGLIQHDSVDVCFCFLLTEIDPLKKLTQTLKIDENSQFLVESNLPTSNPLSGRVYVNFGGGCIGLKPWLVYSQSKQNMEDLGIN